MKIDHERIKHLAFCTRCGFPKKLTIYILRQRIATDEHDGFYCDNCSIKNVLPDYLIQYIKEFVENENK